MNEPQIIRPNPGHIILPRRFVDVGMPRASVTAKGQYRLRVFNADDVQSDGSVRERDIVQDTGWFDNIILNSGLNRMGTGGWISGAAIGTGTAAPDASQTQLQTEVHWTTTAGTGNGVVSALGASPYNNTRTYVYRTALGALNGNYSEVGVGWASGSMYSRALILNVGGSPTTISVNSGQQLDIAYQLSIYPPLADIGPSLVTISSNDYSVTGRAANVNATSNFGPAWSVFTDAAVSLNSNYSGGVSSSAMAAITSFPSFSGGPPTTDTYVNSSLQRTGFQTFGLTAGNVGGALSAGATWGNGSNLQFASFQYQFDPVIPKDGTKTMVLNYMVSWARRP